tara:strand:- start:1657 stop:2184 length:528 start_codon:yes stop_codon:yes gene_type:complete
MLQNKTNYYRDTIDFYRDTIGERLINHLLIERDIYGRMVNTRKLSQLCIYFSQNFTRCKIRCFIEISTIENKKITISDIAKSCQIQYPVTFNIIKTAEEAGWIRIEEVENRKYISASEEMLVDTLDWCTWKERTYNRRGYFYLNDEQKEILQTKCCNKYLEKSKCCIITNNFEKR